MTTHVSGAGNMLLEMKRFSNINKFSGYRICGIIDVQVTSPTNNTSSSLIIEVRKSVNSIKKTDLLDQEVNKLKHNKMTFADQLNVMKGSEQLLLPDNGETTTAARQTWSANV